MAEHVVHLHSIFDLVDTDDVVLSFEWHGRRGGQPVNRVLVDTVTDTRVSLAYVDASAARPITHVARPIWPEESELLPEHVVVLIEEHVALAAAMRALGKEQAALAAAMRALDDLPTT